TTGCRSTRVRTIGPVAAAGCRAGRTDYNWRFPFTGRGTLGGRPTVGHVALDHGIGVRIPASQPHPFLGFPRSFLDSRERRILPAMPCLLSTVFVGSCVFEPSR